MADRTPAIAAPKIEFSAVPPYGSFDDLRGVVTGVGPLTSYRVVVYVFVIKSGGWWLKPYFENPVTAINEDGTFVVDITTGGITDTLSNLEVHGCRHTQSWSCHQRGHQLLAQ